MTIQEILNYLAKNDKSVNPNVLKSMLSQCLQDVALDTSDATALSSDIKKGKTAYVNGKKITGSYVAPVITKPAE